MTSRPSFKPKQRPSSAIYIGSEFVISPPNIPDLPEPPSPVASNSSNDSGLPSPPATNSTGSGSTGDNDNTSSFGTVGRRQRPASLNMPNEENVDDMNTASSSARVEDDDTNENEAENEDNTARLDQRLSSNENTLALQRSKDLAQRNRMTLNKLNRLSSPSPVSSHGFSEQRNPSPQIHPPHSASSSSSSNTASSHVSGLSSHSRRSSHPPRSDFNSSHSRTLYAHDLIPEQHSGSETERESTRHSYHSPAAPSTHSCSSSSSQYSYTDNVSPSNACTSRSDTQQRVPRTPPSQRIRHTSAPASPATALERVSNKHTSPGSRNSSRAHTPRKRASIAMTSPDYDYEDKDFDRDSYGRSHGSRTSSRLRLVDEDRRRKAEDVTQSALAAVASARRSPSTLSRRSRHPLPREFFDHNRGGTSVSGSSSRTTRTGSRGSVDGGSGGGSIAESAITPSRANGKHTGEPSTPHHIPLASSSSHSLSAIHRSSSRSSTVHEVARRHQIRWMSDDISSVNSVHPETNGHGADSSVSRAGRRQSLRGGSAESALGLGPGRSLIGEGLIAAGLRKRESIDNPRVGDLFTTTDGRQTDHTGTGHDAEIRSLSRFSGRSSRIGEGVGPPTRANVTTTFADISHGRDSSIRIAPAPRAATSMASYASLNENRTDEDDAETEPRTAPPALKTYPSTPGLQTQARVDPSLGTRQRYNSPFWNASQRTSGGTMLAIHTKLMADSLTMFETHMGRLVLPGHGHEVDQLVRNAASVVSAAERVNDLLRSGTNQALEEQVNAEIGDGTDGIDLTELWRKVGSDWREGLRASDELVRGVTELLLNVGKLVKDLTSSAADVGHGRSMSLDEEVVGRTGGGSDQGSAGLSGRRSVESGRSWESAARERQRERDETLRKLSSGAGVSSKRTESSTVVRRQAGLREQETQRSSPLLPSTGRSSRTLTPREASHLMQTSESQETVHGHEPSPTPAPRYQTQRPILLTSSTRSQNTTERNRVLPPLSIPPPLPTLPSESLVQRSKTLPSQKFSTSTVREHRPKLSVASNTTVRPNPVFPTLTPRSATIALTTHTVSISPDRMQFSQLNHSESDLTGASTRSHAVTFSKPPNASGIALSGLRDLHYRQRTISNTSSTKDEPSTSVPSAPILAPVSRVKGPITPLSGSETERDTRRRTIGVRTSRASLDSPSGAPSQGTMPANPARRERRRTVTEVFGRD